MSQCRAASWVPFRSAHALFVLTGLFALLLAGCDQLAPTEEVAAESPPVAFPPPQAEPIEAPPRTGAQIVEEFNALAPTARNDQRLLELSQQTDQLAGITTLDLGGSAVTDGGAECLPQFVAVTELSLAGSRVSGKALEHVAEMPALQVLNFDNVRIDDVSLAALAQAPQLRELSLHGSGLTDVAFEHLAAIEGLQVLQVSGNDVLVGRTFAELVKDRRFAGLTTLIADGTLFGYGGIAELGQLKELRTLSLNRCDVADEAVQRLQSCTGLEILRLGDNKLTDEGLKSLTRLKQLKELQLHGNAAVTDDGLARLRGLPQLELLSLDGTRCTLEAARDLKQKSLQQTTIRIAGQEL